MLEMDPPKEVAKHLSKQKAQMDGFHVEILKSKSLALISDTNTLHLLKKWSLDKMHISAWAFNEAYHPNAAVKLWEAITKKCKSAGILLPSTEGIVLEPVPVTVTTKDFLGRLVDPDNNVVHKGGGTIRGCFEEVIDDVIVADNLRQMLLNVESPTFQVYSRQERQELLFRILKILALGGGNWCQYEDTIQPYIDVSLKIYKYLLSVQRDPVTTQVQIRSKCFSAKLPAFSPNQDFIYLLIDPPLREATLFAHTA